MSVLVDSSVWVDYFRGTERSGELDVLIDENMVATNDLILTELLPVLVLRRQRRLSRLLREVTRPPLSIDWEEIIRMQVACLRKGINGVGIPDLIVAQHAIQNGLSLFSYDRHFLALGGLLPLHLYS